MRIEKNFNSIRKLRTKVLPIIQVSRTHEVQLGEEILSILRTKIYRKLLLIMPEVSKDLIQNTQDILVTSISKGDLRYEDDGISGHLTAVTSRQLKALGAVWRRGRWVIRRDRLPKDVQLALQRSERLEAGLRLKLQAVLEGIKIDQVVQEIHGTPSLESAATEIDKKFLKSVRSLGIQPRLSERAKRRIAEEYQSNLRLSIKNWLEKDILRLRQQVIGRVFRGNRYDDLARFIEGAYGVGKVKSRFIARQETMLMTTKLKETRYQDAGIDSYYWVSVKGTSAHPVRPLHKKLDAESRAGKIFHFSDPPISGPKGEKQNPGEPYNCRCVARPVIRVS